MEHRTIIFVDGYCNLCNGLVQFLLAIDRKGILYFTSIQSDFAKQILSNQSIDFQAPKTVYLLKNNTLYDKSMAIIEISKSLGFPFSILTVFQILPIQFRDFVYDVIARNRYNLFGKSKDCRLSQNTIHPRIL